MRMLPYKCRPQLAVKHGTQYLGSVQLSLSGFWCELFGGGPAACLCCGLLDADSLPTAGREVESSP